MLVLNVMEQLQEIAGKPSHPLKNRPQRVIATGFENNFPLFASLSTRSDGHFQKSACVYYARETT